MSSDTIRRIEQGKDPAKDQVFMMDQAYGCDGELIEYWLGRLKLSCQLLKRKAARAATRTVAR